MKLNIRVVVAIAVLGAVAFGVIFVIARSEQKKSHAQEARRVKTEQGRVAMENEQKHIALEQEQERRVLALAQEQRQRILAQKRQQDLLALQKEEERKQEEERILSETPVVLSSNNFVELSFSRGEVVQLDPDGLILRGDNGFLPRAPWSSITENDAKILLRTPKIFATATVFGPNANAANISTDRDQSSLEQQMGEMWHKGNSLRARLITRITVLRMCKEYNQTRAGHFAALVNSQAYDRQAEIQTQQKYSSRAQPTAGLNAGQYFSLSPEAQEDYTSGRIGGSPGDLLRQMAVHQLMSAGQQKANDAKRTQQDISDAKAEQFRQISRDQADGADSAIARMSAYRKALAEMGFIFGHTNEFSFIPPMNLRREIAVELNSEAKN